MRAVVIDWLIDVHIQFHLLPQTLFLAINLLDRYLERTKTTKEELQLIGMTALILASKYEEILYPETHDAEFVTEGACKTQEILCMESKMLIVLEFSLTTITPYNLLDILTRRLKRAYDSISCGMYLSPSWKTLEMLARYILELQMIEYRMMKYCPSVIAMGSLYLCWKILRTIEIRKKILDWPQEMSHVINHDEKDVRDCAKDLYVIMRNAEKCPLQAIRKKYMSEEYERISLIKLPEEADRKAHPKVKEPIRIYNFKVAR